MASLKSALRVIVDTALRPYAGVVFSSDPKVGLLVLLAIATFPKVLSATAVAVAVAALVSLAVGYGAATVRAGTHGTTALLTALAVAVFAPDGGNPWFLVVAGAIVAVFLQASFEAVFAPVALPTHSLPFVAATWVVHLASRVLPAPATPMRWAVPSEHLPAAWFDPSWLDLPAAVVFLSGSAAGVLLIAALLLHSRIATILGALGAAVAVGLRFAVRSEVPWSMVDTTASFNAILASIALGSVWFVPHPSSILLGSAAAAVASLLTYALIPLMGIASLPVVSLPFVITTHLMLTAARRRASDRWPRSAVPAARPEEALAAHLVWVRRFGDAAWLPFRLPFRGEWEVTQGFDGAHTHKGPWRHGLDFEVRGKDGKLFEREGADVRDFRCYGLPVLAAGTGTVAHVVDGIPDNRVGEMNVRDNWGNAVVIAHGAGLYSVYAHLQPRSVKVKTGDVVTSGAEIARCGSSGRAATPHLHFQVQTAAPLGSPTIAADFGDVVTTSQSPVVLANRVVPTEGQSVRAVVRDEALARTLAFPAGMKVSLRELGSGHEERGEVEIDLYGRTMVKSDAGKLYLDPYESGLVVIDFEGSPRSPLRYLLQAMARVPFDQAQSLKWTDGLPLRMLLPGWLRPLADLVALVAPGFGTTPVDYVSRREEGSWHLEGRARGWRTHVELRLGGSTHRVEVEHAGRKRTFELTLEAPDGRGGHATR